MKNQDYIITNANRAVARIAYKTNDVCPIYPITPASEMSELCEEWSATNQKNIFGSVPVTFEMQSEAGVAGAMHGALQTGSLSTTFTASQGLLLMLPNMYKIAGELTPNVIHVATRTVATHALSVFGGHSDVMAVRNSGYALLGAASVQEAQDFALIAQAATLKSNIPFVHFFDGFRTSHETNKIKDIDDTVIKTMIETEFVQKHKDNALNPNNPVLRGTSQDSSTYFQSREAVNSVYDTCPQIVQDVMNFFYTLTGREYKLFEYVGDPSAEHIIITMASATQTIEKTIDYLNSQKGEKFGLIKVRLYRPFSKEHLLKALPSTCKSIAVLDRTKESGATGEPLYLDILQSLMELKKFNKINHLPKIIGGRYGLSSKEFTPAMVKAIFENLTKETSKNNFTVGIKDDVTHLSLDYGNALKLNSDVIQALFYETKSNETCKSFKSTLQLIGSNEKTYIQGYTEIDCKKYNARHVSNIRISNTEIKAPYLIETADYAACQNVSFINNDNTLDRIKKGGVLIINSDESPHGTWDKIHKDKRRIIQEKEIHVLVYHKNATEFNNKISSLHSAFLTLLSEKFTDFNMLEKKIQLIKVNTNRFTSPIPNAVDIPNNSFINTLTNGKGNELPVSEFPIDGTYQTNTSQYNQPLNNQLLPDWDFSDCTQCGVCSLACPSAALRIKMLDDTTLATAPQSFKTVRSIEKNWEADLLNYTIQINPDQCTSCNNCVDACSVNALNLKNKQDFLAIEKENWNFFETIPEFDRTRIDTSKVNQQQLQEPLFKYSTGDESCGEAPYLKLVSQLFGDRMLVANATGASSIFGGALPTTPWSKNQMGRGPAWSNSLFEDNAEFGLGYRLSLDQQKEQALHLLNELVSELDFNLANDIIISEQNSDKEIENQRERIIQLNKKLHNLNIPKAKQLLNISESLIKKSIWIVGGDGWAYDIGFGGIDHVIASGKNVNILILDNELYANTGGQMSKATPMGATSKFAFNGKVRQKKDFGLMAMTYDDVYVASVSLGANPEHTLKTFIEAESYNGPSIIIAYSHSSVHGIDIKSPIKYHKASVASGQWILYNNDPRRTSKGLNPFKLVSKKPKTPIETYLKMEKRFERLFQKKSHISKRLINTIQEKTDLRFKKCQLKSQAALPVDTKKEIPKKYREHYYL